MPWTKDDYLVSMKNLNEYVRLKAIDIANAMVTDGYEEDRAIPIAISTAKDWYENASNYEKGQLKKEDLTDHEKSSNSARLQDADVIVDYDKEEKSWKVISKGAKRADSYHKRKEEAVARGKEIVEFREGKLIVKNKGDK